MSKSITKQAHEVIALQDGRRKAIDWEAIESDYVKDEMSLRQLAEKHGVGHNTIAKRVKKYNWVKDITDKVKQRADHLVSQKVKEISGLGVQKGVQFQELSTIEANADHLAQIDWRHRTTILNLHERNTKIAEMLDKIIDENELLTLEVQQALDDGQLEPHQVNKALHVLAIPSIVDTNKKLLESTKLQIELERKITKLDTTNTDGDEKANIVIDFAQPLED